MGVCRPCTAHALPMHCRVDLRAACTFNAMQRKLLSSQGVAEGGIL